MKPPNGILFQDVLVADLVGFGYTRIIFIVDSGLPNCAVYRAFYNPSGGQRVSGSMSHGHPMSGNGHGHGHGAGHSSEPNIQVICLVSCPIVLDRLYGTITNAQIRDLEAVPARTM